MPSEPQDPAERPSERPSEPPPAPSPPPVPSPTEVADRHVRIGWAGLFVFVTLGIALEAFHAFKWGSYLGVGAEPRRLMLTLAHAHGVGLSLLHLGFAFTLRGATAAPLRLWLVSALLTWGTVLVPGGFLLGSLGIHGGDPGPGVWLVPIGALCVWQAVLLVTRAVLRAR